MHRILERQIKHSFGLSSFADASPELLTLLQMVSDTYTHADEDRALLSRSLDLSSKEFAEMNKRLHVEKEIIERQVRSRTIALEYEQAKLRTIAEYMTMGTILLDTEGHATFLNRSASELLGMPALEQAVEALASRFPSIDVHAHIEESLRGKSITLPEVEADGMVFSLSFASLSIEAGAFSALVWINDITGAVLLERAKSQFIAIASHEMRTPLAVIRGNAELILADKKITADTELSEEAQHILSSAVRLLGIVNDFLDLQNLENRKVSLKIEEFDLIGCIRDVVSDLSGIAAKKNIGVAFDATRAPESLAVKLDRTRLQQICTNLISNAIHYTEKGGVTVSVEKTDAAVVVRCADTGVGISAEDQKRLFKKFSTIRSSVHTQEYGSGLGLYIADLLARAMDCEVKLEKSEVGKGSTFSLAIPTAAICERDS